MKFNHRSLIRTFLALAMIAAPSGAVIASVDQHTPGLGNRDINSASTVWESGMADGAGIPGEADVKVDKPSATGHSALFFVGVGIIVIAFLGRRILQK